MGNGEDMGIRYLADLMKQVQNDLNNRFDRLDDRYDAVTDRLTEIDKTYVKRDEMQQSMKQMLDDFSKLTGKIEGIFTALAEIRPVVDDIVPRVEHEARWEAYNKRFETLEKDLNTKDTSKIGFANGLKISLISGVTVTVFSLLIQYFINHQ
jgi:predicted nuclease with TOPRIM domain